MDYWETEEFAKEVAELAKVMERSANLCSSSDFHSMTDYGYRWLAGAVISHYRYSKNEDSTDN